jgi:hypothetical protein
MAERRSRRDPDLRAAAQALTLEAVKTLAEIMRSGASEHARVAAAAAILDRGHGKAVQGVKLGGDAEAAPIQHVIRWAETVSEATPDPCRKEPSPKS